MVTITKINQSNISLFQAVYQKRTNKPLHQNEVTNQHLYCFVIHDENDSFGWISVVKIPKIGISNQVFYIDELYVDTIYRKNGFGSQLVKYVIREFDDKELRLYVELNNQDAIKLYKDAGFKTINQTNYMIRLENGLKD